MSKLGLHVSGPNRRGFGDALRTCADAGSPIPVVFALNQNVHADIQRYSPSTVLIYRDDRYGPDTGRMYEGDPVAQGINFVMRYSSVWKVNPANYYAVINEPGRTDPAALAWLNDFFIGCMETAYSLGVKLCLYEWSTGMPPLENVALVQPSLTMAKAHGHILGLHEYSLNGPMIGSPLCLRYRDLYARLPFIARPNFVISEAGPGGGYDTGYSGTAYVNVVAGYDAEVMKDDYVIGAALFDLGGGESNMQPVLGDLSAYIATHPTPINPPPPVDRVDIESTLPVDVRRLSSLKSVRVAVPPGVIVTVNGAPQ